MSHFVCGKTTSFLLALASAVGLVMTGMHPANASRTRVDPEKDPKAGEEREFEIANGVKMKFCWMPSGAARLGSPKTELDAVAEQLRKFEMIDTTLETQAEGVRGKFLTTGFWLGKYPVTQSEWVAVMGNNPSGFNGKYDNQAKGLETSRFPVECVRWYDCQEFLDKVNGRVGRAGVARVFGKKGRFVLPHEDQWEYACRGGKGNKRAYYWGDELNGTQANCKGCVPFGTATKGQYLERTCSVDFTNEGKYAKHPWGLCHMVGNVSQWCDNKYEQSDDDRVDRGGSWEDYAYKCRSASRGVCDPGLPFNAIGFRVCLHLEKY